MSASIQIDPNDPTPPFEQMRRQLALLIETGQLAAGDRLPPVRQLANDLALAAGTVARTYRELEAEGLVESRRGGGTTVAALAGLSERERAERLRSAASSYAETARMLGLTRDEAMDALSRHWAGPLT